MEVCALAEGGGVHTGSLEACLECEALLCENCIDSEAVRCDEPNCQRAICHECVDTAPRDNDPLKVCDVCTLAVCRECAVEVFAECETVRSHIILCCRDHPVHRGLLYERCDDCRTIRCLEHAVDDLRPCVFCERPVCEGCDNDTTAAVQAFDPNVPLPDRCVRVCA